MAKKAELSIWIVPPTKTLMTGIPMVRGEWNIEDTHLLFSFLVSLYYGV
jgi:hypothetical protein